VGKHVGDRQVRDAAIAEQELGRAEQRGARLAVLSLRGEPGNPRDPTLPDD
jgi:hypothetical protein